MRLVPVWSMATPASLLPPLRPSMTASADIATVPTTPVALSVGTVAVAFEPDAASRPLLMVHVPRWTPHVPGPQAAGTCTGRDTSAEPVVALRLKSSHDSTTGAAAPPSRSLAVRDALDTPPRVAALACVAEAGTTHATQTTAAEPRRRAMRCIVSPR